jgi:hypothetical protein
MRTCCPVSAAARQAVVYPGNQDAGQIGLARSPTGGKTQQLLSFMHIAALQMSGCHK